jgi:hypothetical protein
MDSGRDFRKRALFLPLRIWIEFISMVLLLLRVAGDDAYYYCL